MQGRGRDMKVMQSRSQKSRATHVHVPWGEGMRTHLPPEKPVVREMLRWLPWEATWRAWVTYRRAWHYTAVACIARPYTCTWQASAMGIGSERHLHQRARCAAASWQGAQCNMAIRHGGSAWRW